MEIFYCRGRAGIHFFNAGAGAGPIYIFFYCRGRAGIKNFEMTGAGPGLEKLKMPRPGRDWSLFKKPWPGQDTFSNTRAGPGLDIFFQYRGRERTGISNSIITGASLTLSLRSTNIYQLSNHFN